MNRVEVEKEISRIFFNIFGKENPFTIKEIEEKFAFDVKLPKQVKDSVTGEITWSEMENAKKYIKQDTMRKYDQVKRLDGFEERHKITKRYNRCMG